MGNKLSLGETMRGWAGVLGMWHVCANPSCHAARACRGDIRRCAPGNFALLPVGVQAWFFRLLAARNEGLPFDAARSQLDRTEAGAAFRDWTAALGAAGRALGETPGRETERDAGREEGPSARV